MKKGVFVITTVDGYGADKSILENITYLTKQKKIEAIVILPKNGPIEKMLKINNINYILAYQNSWNKGPKYSKLLFFKRNIKLLLNIFSAIKIVTFNFSLFKNVEFVHTNTFTTFFGIILSKILRVKHIMHLREIPFEQFRFEYEFSEKKIYHWVSKNTYLFLSNSEYTNNYFKEKLVNAEIKFVPNPIFKEVNNNSLSLLTNKDIIKFILLGRYEDAKNQMDALEACLIMKNKGNYNFSLTLFGSGVNKSMYEEFVKINCLENFVFINGFNSQIINHLNDFHIGIMTSRYEAFGRVTMEYFSNGLPVIGNETGNTPYLVEDGKNGFIYSFKNPASLADKMQWFILNKNEVTTMGKYAQQNSTKRYSLKNSSDVFFDYLNC